MPKSDAVEAWFHHGEGGPCVDNRGLEPCSCDAAQPLLHTRWQGMEDFPAPGLCHALLSVSLPFSMWSFVLAESLAGRGRAGSVESQQGSDYSLSTCFKTDGSETRLDLFTGDSPAPYLLYG